MSQFCSTSALARAAMAAAPCGSSNSDRIFDGERRRVVGQGADLTVRSGQAFRAQAGRYDRNARRESLQQFHAHARAAQNGTDEDRIARRGVRGCLPPRRAVRCCPGCGRRRQGGGSHPTTTSRASGRCAQTTGSTSPANQVRAAALGRWRKLPTNSMVRGSRPPGR